MEQQDIHTVLPGSHIVNTPVTKFSRPLMEAVFYFILFYFVFVFLNVISKKKSTNQAEPVAP